MAAGVWQRHNSKCNRKRGCKCPWQASVYSKRDGKKIRKAFPSQAAAVAWRDDARSSGTQDNHARSHVDHAQAGRADGLLAGIGDGSIPTRSGTRYKPAAIRSYAEALRLRVLPALGDMRLSDVRRADVQDLADRLTTEGLAASTVQNQLDPRRVIFRRAVRRDFVAVDPTKGLELRKPDGRRDRIASPDEARELLDALPAEERALWATALYAGLRHGELRALRWADIDIEGLVIGVARGWDAKEGEQDGGTGAAARRTVPLITRLAPFLAAHKLATCRDDDALVFGDRRSPVRAVHGPPPRAGGVGLEDLHLTRSPHPGRGGSPSRHATTRLSGIGLHEARHTFASLMIAAGVNAKALSDHHGSRDDRLHLRCLRTPDARRRG